MPTPTKKSPNPDHEKLVESYLVDHPWSTIVDIREGIASEDGVQIERVQARLAKIGKRRVVETDTATHGRTAYRLGGDREVVDLLGIEVQIKVINGEITLTVTNQKSSVKDPELAKLANDLKAKLRASMATKVVPACERVASRLGLLSAEEEDTFGIFAALDE